MKRAYNHKISEKANISLSKREERVRIQKILIGAAVIIIISLIILLGTHISAFAGLQEASPQPQDKHYASIEIQSGDTLWGIAGKFTQGSDVAVTDYIDEVCRLNHLSDSEIHCGKYLIVPDYSVEE